MTSNRLVDNSPSKPDNQGPAPAEPLVMAYRVGSDGVYATLPSCKEYGFTVCGLCGMAYILLVHDASDTAELTISPAQYLLMERAVNASHATGHPEQLRSDRECVHVTLEPQARPADRSSRQHTGGRTSGLDTATQSTGSLQGIPTE